MRPFITNWLSLSRLINGKDSVNKDILKYDSTAKSYVNSLQRAVLHTTVGGAASEDVAISGVLPTDVVVVTLHTAGSTPRTISKAVAGTDEVTITFSGDPAADHIVNILVSRP